MSTEGDELRYFKEECRTRFSDLALQIKYAGRDILNIGLLVLSLLLLVASMLLGLYTANQAKVNAREIDRLHAEIEDMKRDGATMGSAWQAKIKESILEELRAEEEHHP